MSQKKPTVEISPEALMKVASLRLSGAPLATWFVLLAHLDNTGRAAVTQPQLEQILDTGGGRVWQSLQKLVAAGLIERPKGKAGGHRRTPYRIPESVAMAPDVMPLERKPRP